MNSESIPILPSYLQPINEAAKVIWLAQNNYDFFFSLTQHLMPILEHAPMLRSVRQRWSDQSSQHCQAVKESEAYAKKQVRSDYKRIESIVKKANLLEVEGVRSLLQRVENLLTGQEPYYTPPEYEMAYDYLCEVVSLLVEKNHGDLFQKYVTINKRLEYQEGADGLRVLVQVPYVSEFHIAPEVLKVRTLRGVWFWTSKEPWVLWHYFGAAVWAWNCPADHFKNETMRSSTTVIRKRTMNLLNQQSCLSEMKSIQSRDATRSQHFFSVNRFREWLRVLLMEFLTVAAKIEISADLQITVHQLSLYYDSLNRLWLKVRWYADAPQEEYCLQQFREDSEGWKFARLLAKEYTETTIPSVLSHPSNIISRCSLDKGGLRDIFFGQYSQNGVHFYGSIVKDISRNESQLKELMDHLRARHAKYGNPSPPSELFKV